MKPILGGFGLISGATYPLRALRLFWQSPGLWNYSVAPIALNIAIGGVLYAVLWPYGRRFSQAIARGADAAVARLPAWLNFLDNLAAAFAWLTQVVLALGLSVLVGLVLVQFGTLLGAPFYGRLSERVEKLRTGALVVVEVSPARDLGRAVLFELKKLALALPLALLLLGSSLFPGPGTAIAGIGGIALSGLLVGLDFLDGALERRRLRFRHKLAIILGAFPASGSFSLVCLLLVGIPLLNFFTVPLCVAAGTLFACDRILPQLQDTPTR